MTKIIKKCKVSPFLHCNLSPLEQIVNLIQQSEKILVLAHANPDGDAIGSVLALTLVLRKLGKKVIAAAADPAPHTLRFLPALTALDTSIPGTNDLVISLPLADRTDAEVSHRIEDGYLKIFVHPKGKPWSKSDIQIGAGDTDCDLIICCDTPELPQLGKLFEANPNIFYETPVINIDHHTSNTGFGKINLVDATASASAEIILRLIRSLESKTDQKLLDADIATLILAGIIADTGSFQNSNTTPRSFEVSADLIDAGARRGEIIQHIYKTKALSTLRLWGKVLSKIEFDPICRIVWSVVTTDDLNATDATDEDAKGILDELMTNAPGAEVVVLLRQKGDTVSGSIRTTTPAVSAIDIAALFGGGGHLRAAGFKLPQRKVESATEEVIGAIRKFQTKRLNLHAASVESEVEKPKK